MTLSSFPRVMAALTLMSWSVAAASAGEQAADEQTAAEAAEAISPGAIQDRIGLEAPERRFGFEMGAAWYSAYFFRGYQIEDEGFIFQPFAEARFMLLSPAEEDGLSVTASLGTWHSLHSEHTGSTGSSVDIWNEADFYGGLSFAWDNLTIDADYIVYAYPNNADFPAVHELVFALTVDLPDEHWCGKWLGDPSVLLGVEVDNSNVGQEHASYFQLGFGPSFAVLDERATLSIPVALGFSISDYYTSGEDDETFGFAQIGAAVDVPLCEGDDGTVTLSGGVNFIVLGDAVQDVNDGDSSDVIAFLGISYSY